MQARQAERICGETHSIEQGRGVFAAQGNVASRGGVDCNWLIQEGAKLVIEPLDITTELNLHLVPQQKKMEILNLSRSKAWLPGAPTLPYGSWWQMDLC